MANEEQKEARSVATKAPSGGGAEQRAAQSGQVREYINDTRNELRKVVWPSREEAINLTTVVLAVTLAMTILLGGLDSLYSSLLEALLRAWGIR